MSFFGLETTIARYLSSAVETNSFLNVVWFSMLQERGVERLQRFLAHAGVASRRKAEGLIRAGRVRVNGQVVTELGIKVDATRDSITVDEQPITTSRSSPRTYIILHKPKSVLSTTVDPLGRHTVLDLVQTASRIYPVGRLDRDSEGLILLTNDGELTYRLTHPKYEHQKEYRVLVDGQPDKCALQLLREGVNLEEGVTWPAKVIVDTSRSTERMTEQQEGTWLQIVIHEGRKRQLRRMCRVVGHPVRRLIRVRMGPLMLGELQPGEWRQLTTREVRTLKESTDVEKTFYHRH